jgi:hypothetical protein
MRALGLAVVVPLLVILFAIMVRASQPRLEVDLRDRRPGSREPSQAAARGEPRKRS